MVAEVDEGDNLAGKELEPWGSGDRVGEAGLSSEKLVIRGGEEKLERGKSGQAIDLVS